MTERSTHLVERAAAFLRSDAGLTGDADAAPTAPAPPTAPVDAKTPMVADGLDSMARQVVTPSAAPPVLAAARVELETMLRAGLSVAGHGRSRIAEEYRVTVDRLLRGLRAARSGAERTNLMLVTSAKPGEGKTFTALNLAASIVRNGLGEAVLVDMDAKPLSLTWQFGLTDAPGLLNLVANPALRVDDLLLQTAVDGLLYLPIGTRGLPGNGTDVIRPINAAVERIARRFPRHIVVADCPPCLSSSDPVTLAPLADQIVLVVEAERTQRGEIESALELIHACQNVTLVLNKLQLTTNSTFGAYYGTSSSIVSPSRINALPVVLLATVTAAVGWVAPAAAQMALPGTGITTNVGDLRQQVEGLYSFGASTPGAPGWTVVPSIGLSEQWTDNVLNSSGKKQSSFITVINPAVLVNADTDRVKGTLNFAPSASIYTNAPEQNQFNNNFNGNAQITLLPEHLFLNLQGYGAVQATSGGLGPSNTTALNRQNATQSYAFSASPYWRERFGDIGTGEVGVSYAYTSQQNLSSPSTAVPQATDLNQFMSGTREYVAFTSGPVLGRTAVSVLGSATQMNGTGVSNNAYRNIATVDVGYAITRSITALGTIGWEDIKYATVPVYKVNDAIWKVGVRWVPNPDSTLTLRYGHVDGFNQAWFDGSYALTERTRLYGNYSESLSSSLESLQSTASNSVMDPLGNPIDPVTGAPLLVTNNFFSVQNNNILYRNTNASLTATTLFDRDVVSLTVSYQKQDPVGSTANAGALAATEATSGTYGAINWQHDLSPDMRTAAYFQYGMTENSSVIGKQNTNSVVASLSFTYLFSEKLVGMVQYSYSSSQARLGGQDSPTNLVVVGIRKTF